MYIVEVIYFLIFKGGVAIMAGILIVDDAAFMRMMLKDIITKKWFNSVWRSL